MKRRRGSTMVESALALTTFALLTGGIMELGFAGLAANSVTFAAQRAARYASLRGSSSGHAATVSDIQAVAQQYAAPLSSGMLTVTVTWSPDNKPGSAVTVQVACTFRPSMLPVSASALRLQSSSRQSIVQ
jgi:Flp pilus assembly protein TadG